MVGNENNNAKKNCNDDTTTVTQQPSITNPPATTTTTTETIINDINNSNDTNSSSNSSISSNNTNNQNNLFINNLINNHNNNNNNNNNSNELSNNMSTIRSLLNSNSTIINNTNNTNRCNLINDTNNNNNNNYNSIASLLTYKNNNLTTATSTTLHSNDVNLMNNNNNIKKFNCISCNRNYNDEEKLKRHINNTHKKEKKFECNICNKKFAYKHILQEHQNLHYGLKPHVCNVCGKKFAAKSNLIQHNRRHKDPSTATTTITTCGVVNTNNQTVVNLVKNSKKQQLKSNLQTFICDICLKRFNSDEVYKRHKTICKQKLEESKNEDVSSDDFENSNEAAQLINNVNDYFQKNTFGMYNDSTQVSMIYQNPTNTLSNWLSTTIANNVNNCGGSGTHASATPPTSLTIQSTSSNHKLQQFFQQKQLHDRSVQVDATSDINQTANMPLDELLLRYEAQDKIFRCQFCDIIFMERGMYFLHIALHSPTNPWECSICHKIMQDRNEFTLHFVNQQHNTN